ncbi:MAG: glucose-1-phosphate thymidylyltransferase [Candidatus Thermoplasmatota archaeon]|nr:glucose-1-phosphate thymidylyltransferase [Candidatus Thermoplasmatota archaeon]MDP7266390.1 glucose-1-phosphate thymidylyltransferase [Candidatus Thermoplasmatota archaeon]
MVLKAGGDEIKGLILAGGSGTRLRPITGTGPKQLIPIANRPVIRYCIQDISNCGISEIGIILGNNYPHKIIDLLGDGRELGVNFTYIRQGQPLGIAHAIGSARDFLGNERFVVYLGDNLLKSGISNIAEEFTQNKLESMILLSRVREPSRFGVAVMDDDGNVVDLVEKPDKPPSPFALVGVYFLTDKIFPIIDSLRPSGRGELEITDALRILMKSGHGVEARTVSGWWKDTGRVEDILEANRLILEDLYEKKSDPLDHIGKSTHIDGNATIIPPVIIGEGCTILSGAMIGPYVAVGDNCRIQGAGIHDSVIDKNVQIDCSRVIERSLIGKGVRITVSGSGNRDVGGMGDLTLVLGENSHAEF